MVEGKDCWKSFLVRPLLLLTAAKREVPRWLYLRLPPITRTAKGTNWEAVLRITLFRAIIRLRRFGVFGFRESSKRGLRRGKKEANRRLSRSLGF